MIVALFESDNKYMTEGVYFVNTENLHGMGVEYDLKKLLTETVPDELNPIELPSHLSFTSGAWGKDMRHRVLVNPPFHLEKIIYASVEN